MVKQKKIKRTVPLISHLGCPIIAMTGNSHSTLAKYATIVLNIEVKKEACMMGLAPTSSSTVALALGDALALVLYEQKGFSPRDFARLHPGGELGRKLLLKVSDLMRSREDIPAINENVCVKESAELISFYKTGAIMIVGPNDELKGIVTDGDLRRHILDQDLANTPIKKIMNNQPICVKKDDFLIDVMMRFL